LHCARQLRSVRSVSGATPARTNDAAIDAFRDVPLLPHTPGTASPVHSLAVSGVLQHSGVLAVEFRLSAALRAIRLVPVVCQPRRRDELWRHTCFEVFARRGGQSRYCEFNLSASGDWAAYQFEKYRGTRSDAKQEPIAVTVHTSGEQQITLRARIDLDAALADEPGQRQPHEWRLNCAAVIECGDGSLEYWAVHHPRTQPDFHDADGFRIALRATGAGLAAEPT
jgi:hypothetical protein